MNHEACKSTHWGLFQAIMELEDFRNGGTDIGAATSALAGDRAAAKERAFDLSLEVCGGRRMRRT
ncbi:MAG: hypothetical protein HYU88_13845 [Chloroflexi bacterium]|nr:hypothetical protein [Chloroflexota bacterium]MBI4506520.1 hypothetical protein [Chloroflexota bacterium]